MTQGAVEKIIIDEFLPLDADCPVFGFNLACAYPFPGVAAEWYQGIAGRLSGLDAGVYVYPDWETHVTIVTFVNFSLHRRPDEGRVEELRGLIKPVSEILKKVLSGQAFSLLIGKPVLTPKAVILPISNSTGEIVRIRSDVVAAIRREAELCRKLIEAGLNVPRIIHSTVMRFKSGPADLKRFCAGFEEIVASVEPVEIKIEELFLTLELKPYMREGRVEERFALAPV